MQAIWTWGIALRARSLDISMVSSLCALEALKMFNLRNTPLSKILTVLAVLALVFGVVVSPVLAQTPAPVVSRYADLPMRGQLVIPVGSQFVVPAELDGLEVTIWRGMADATVESVVEFSNSIASDRADRYGGEPADFQTVVWDKSVHPLPGFSGRKGCDDAFGHDAATLVAGVSIGDAGCFEMIEYDRSQQPDFAVATVASTSTSVPAAAATLPAMVESTPAPAATPQAYAPPTNGMPVQIAIDPNFVSLLMMLGYAFLFCGVPLLVLGLLFYALVRALRRPRA